MGALSKGTMVVGVLCFFYGIFPVNVAEGLGFEVWSDVLSRVNECSAGFALGSAEFGYFANLTTQLVGAGSGCGGYPEWAVLTGMTDGFLGAGACGEAVRVCDEVGGFFKRRRP